ncbi:Hypothetical predicted protein [Lecanosticta acicola]|uniref:Uncharacterized protein n=1 Tax=Lecanosticta acicola TaxID=111012 RepID=A0AAI8Z0E7_9PEZI|nr:Hypothetical predicted protein [Lecanosticta acicola]
MSLSTLVTVEVPIPFELMVAVRENKLHDLCDLSELRDLISNVTESVIRAIKASPYEVKPAHSPNTPLSPGFPATRSPIADSGRGELKMEQEDADQVPSREKTLASVSRREQSAALLKANRALESSLQRKMEAQIIQAITESKTESLQPTHENDHNSTFFEMAEHQIFSLVQKLPVVDDGGKSQKSGIFEIEYAVYRRDCLLDATHDDDDDDPQLGFQLQDIPWRRCGGGGGDDTFHDLDEANAAAVKELRRTRPDNPIILLASASSSSRGFTVRQETSPDGPKYFCLEAQGVGVVEVAVLENFRGVERDFELLHTQDDWTSIPAFFVRRQRCTPPDFQDYDHDSSGRGDLDLDLACCLDLDVANEVAIRLWVELTSEFLSEGEKRARREGLLRRARDEGGWFRARTTGKVWEERWEVWVAVGRVVGPSASLRNSGLRETRDVRG